MYISQDEIFTDFNDTGSLFWFQQDLVYGDWSIGEEGCYEHYKDLEIPEVGGWGGIGGDYTLWSTSIVNSMFIGYLSQRVTNTFVRNYPGGRERDP